MLRLRVAALGAAGLLATAVVSVAAPAYADQEACLGTAADAAPGDPVTAPSEPLKQLGVPAFQKQVAARGSKPGAGVTVAVVDSGVQTMTQIPLVGADPTPVTGTHRQLVYYHGTAVASVIAGAPRPDGQEVGIAPYAGIYDERVYDSDEAGTSDESYRTVDADGVAEGLEHLAARVRSGLHVDIANVSLGVEPSARLAAAVGALTHLGVIVVAPTGNRPADPSGFPTGFSTARRGEDAAGAVFPAGYAVADPLVVAVNSTVDAPTDPTAAVLLNSATDVAAPSTGVVAYALNRQSCLIPDPATSFSTAAVSGVLAGLMSVYDRDTPRQIVARLEATATGLPTAPGVATDKLTGYGVVQPLEALVRPLRIDSSGHVQRSVVPRSQARPASLPEPEPDVLESTRHRALWWGLGGGGSLLVAVMLRPVLARRRH